MKIQQVIDQRQAGTYAHINFDSDKQAQEAERLVNEFVEEYGQPVYMEIAGMAQGGYKIEMSLTESYKDGVVYTVLKSGKSRTDQEITITSKDEVMVRDLDFGNMETEEQCKKFKEALQGQTHFDFHVCYGNYAGNWSLSIYINNPKKGYTEAEIQKLIIQELTRNL